MKPPVLDLVMANDLGEIPALAERFEAFGQAHGLPAKALHDMQVSLDEILSNIVKHAYDDAAPHLIAVRVRIAGGEVVSEVEDDGAPFNPLDAPGAQDPEPPRGKPGGLGIYFVRHLVDRIEYARVGGRNRLVMRLKLA
ncbi:MAG TPA: ATP-binding protein [Usitatibacter sp.]|nr:ATP-binding protein [Usitatibacter sp.]